MNVATLVANARDAAGMAHKRDIRQAYAGLGGAEFAGARVGDDCAALRDGDGYLLFAIEGLLDDFVRAEPWFAGYCGVMVNVSDVYAMGGRPLAIVDALWSADAERGAAIWSGMRAAALAYGVPIVGGHTNARATSERLAVAILGRARALLTSFDARPGDEVLAAIDLRGAYYDPYPYWNCSTTAPPARLRADLDVLVDLANDGLCDAAKDISGGGLLGTLLMLLECSAVGASIDVRRIPMPPAVTIERWLASFPSFGFVLSVASANVAATCERFARRDIACASIGRVTADRRLLIRDGDGDACEFWDLAREPFTGVPVPTTVR